MSDIYVGELQDEDGNTVYPHTEADVCFCTDGKNVQEKINNELLSNAKVLKTIEEIEANTDVENIAGATALKEVNNKLASGRVELVVTEAGELGYKLDGADTVHPFRRTDIVMEYMSANAYGQAGNSRTMTYTAKNPCTLHIRACSGAYGSDRAVIRSYLNSNAYNLRTTQGYCGITHTADIVLNKNDIFSVSCSISNDGGAICLVGYID